MLKSFFRYLLLFILAYGTLLAISSLPIAKLTLSNTFQSSARKVLNLGFSKVYWVIHTEPNTQDPERIRILYESQSIVNEQVAIAKQQQLSKADIEFEAYQIFVREFWVLPFLFLLTLILISPGNPSTHQGRALILRRYYQKFLISIWASLFFCVYTILRILLIMLHQIQVKELAIYQLGSWPSKGLAGVQLFLESMTAPFIIASLIWVMLCFKGDNWKKIVEGLGKDRKLFP